MTMAPITSQLVIIEKKSDGMAAAVTNTKGCFREWRFGRAAAQWTPARGRLGAGSMQVLGV